MTGVLTQPRSTHATRFTPLSERLEKYDFAVFNEAELGFDAEFRAHLLRAYFTERVLESDHPAVHDDRDRARDVIRYDWTGSHVSLQEHDTVEIRDRSGFAGARTPARVNLLSDPMSAAWVAAVLALVPRPQRQPAGTFAVNFFRTRTRVVSGPHQDHEQFVLVYVLDKRGGGGETRLHRVDRPDDIVHRVTLRPGNLIIFRDSAFLHSVTPLRRSRPAPTQRDALVCTVNYAQTYPLG